MNSTMIFNNDNTNTIYTLQNTDSIFYLAIPNSLMENFKTFIKLKKEDNERKGISEIRNETSIRKQLLEDVKKVNILIKDLNNKYVYSKVNHLPELPVAELESILNPNVPFNLEKYKQVAKEIEEKINNSFKLMISSNVKKESMEQVLLFVNEKESDKNFVKWLTIALPMLKHPTTLEELRKIYKKSKIKYNLANYQTIISKEGKKYIAGFDINKIPYLVSIPYDTNIQQLFQNEITNMPIEEFENKSETEIATIIFTDITLHYEKEKMGLNNDYATAQIANVSIETNKISSEKKEETAHKITDNTVKDDLEEAYIAKNNLNESSYFSNTDNNMVNYQDSIITSNEYDNVMDLNKSISKPKTRILIMPRNNNAAFIKVGSILLFTLSFILIIISIVLYIMS